MWGWVLIAILLGIGAVAIAQYRGQAGSYRPLASRQPARRSTKKPLGTEALDLDAVGRANRQNESLERGQTNWLGSSALLGRTVTDIAPLADDETYATRYYKAFQQDRPKD